MRVYKTPEIRNVAVVGHGASGKTSLVDALAFVAGTSKRHGSVKDGTALTDYTADEIERKYSINLALAVAEWMDTKLNLIDTPGYLDFTGDALAGGDEVRALALNLRSIQILHRLVEHVRDRHADHDEVADAEMQGADY